MRRQLELSNEVAAALSGSDDQILRALEGHVDCELFLRGNVITLDGEAEAVAAAAVVVRELSDLIEQGHEIAEGTIAAVTDALDQHESPAEVLEDVVWRHRSTRVAPKTVNQKRYVDSIRRNTITFGIGPAGTGKTFLAVAMAAAALSRREVNRIILTRPAVEAGERLGFLPGDLMAKVDPYLRPLFDALHDMIDPEKVATHLERNVIEVAPLAFMRGRTLNDSFVILDEAQNTSPEQMKMFLTRLGFNSKMVVTGDITQIDLPRDQRSGLVVVGEILDARRGHRVRALRRRRRRAPPARAAHRRGLRRALRARRARAAPRRSARRAAGPERVLEVEVIGDGGAEAPPRAEVERIVGIALASAGVEDGPRRGRVRRRRADRRSSTASTADATGPTDVLSFPVDGDGPTAGPRELGDIVICPEHTEDLREAVVHGALHLTGMDHETDDGRDARPPGRAADVVSRAPSPARASSRSPGARTSASRRSSTRMVGRKVAIVSDKPQTTRRAIRGVATRRRHAARARRPARRPAPARRADRAHAAPRRARAGGVRRRAVRHQRRAGRRPRATASSPSALRGAGVPVVLAVNKVDRLDRAAHARGAAADAAELDLADEVFPVSRAHRRAAWGRCASTSPALHARGAVPLPARGPLGPARATCCWPSSSASRCCGAPSRRSRTPSRSRSTRSRSARTA